MVIVSLNAASPDWGTIIGRITFLPMDSQISQWDSLVRPFIVYELSLRRVFLLRSCKEMLSNRVKILDMSA